MKIIGKMFCMRQRKAAPGRLSYKERLEINHIHAHEILTSIFGICPTAQMETGSISRKLERGKHTTRHSELFEIWEHSYIMDTPGFTAFELDADIEKEQLKDYYPEFYEYEGKCKFQACTHTHEPGCAVKAAVGENRIHKIRYEGYVAIFEELKNRKKYDKKNYIKNT